MERLYTYSDNYYTFQQFGPKEVLNISELLYLTLSYVNPSDHRTVIRVSAASKAWAQHASCFPSFVESCDTGCCCRWHPAHRPPVDLPFQVQPNRFEMILRSMAHYDQPLAFHVVHRRLTSIGSWQLFLPLQSFLQRLSLSYTEGVTDDTCLIIRQLSALVALDVVGTEVTHTGISNLASGLHELCVLRFTPDDAMMEAAGYFSALTSISARMSSCTGSVDSLVRLGSRLTSLNISLSPKLRVDGLANIAAYLPNLKSINLGMLRVKGSHLVHLHKLKNLTSVDIPALPEVTDSVVANLSNAIPGLRHLGLGRTEIMAASRLPVSLTSLDVSTCRGVTCDRLLAIVAATGHQLKRFCMRSCRLDRRLNDAVSAVVTTCHALEYLDISHNTIFVTDETFALCAKLQSLLVLHASGSTKLTDVGLAHVTSMRSIRSLIITECTSVTSVGLRAISCVGTLRLVDHTGCGAPDDSWLGNSPCHPQYHRAAYWFWEAEPLDDMLWD